MQYDIIGGQLPVLVCKMQQGESLFTESGAMSWMTNDFQMNTNTGGGIGKMFGRMFSGESLFMNTYTCNGPQGEIAFASSFVGSIMPFNIEPGKSLICQKSAFLAATSGVELSAFLQKKLGAGFFGGEGFVMQKLSGQGLAFVELDGYVVEKTLAPGEKLVISTGNLAAVEETVSIDIQMVKGVKNMFLGGEGLFNTYLTGPGKVYLQSMPKTELANSIAPYLPQKSN